MASEMVERLAAAWASETGSRFPSQDARCWINAIADDPECPSEFRDWLRAQAEEKHDE